MNPYSIRTVNLSRHFQTVRAVDDVSFEIAAGTVFGFLGPNGSGKTTTIRLLLGLLEPSGGRAEVLGFDILKQADNIRQRCGALLEHNGLYERLSAEDNLEFYGRVWHMQSAERKARIKDLMTHMGLWERRGETVREWSRGMKQKLAVARAMLHRPALLFLDEPTAGLDPVAAVSLREDLAFLAEREEVTIFLTTHNLAEAEKLCQQVGVIRKGKLLAVGALEQLRNQAGGRSVEIAGKGFTSDVINQLKSRPEVCNIQRHNGNIKIELTGAIEVAPLVRTLVMAGADVEAVHEDKANLEELFLALMSEDSNGKEA